MTRLGSGNNGSNTTPVNTGPTINSGPDIQPVPIFANANALNIHKDPKIQYGKSSSANAEGSYSYTKYIGDGNFDIYAPVKCHIAYGVNTLSGKDRNSIILRLDETVGMFKSGGLMLIGSGYGPKNNDGQLKFVNEKTTFQKGEKIATTTNKTAIVSFNYDNSFNPAKYRGFHGTVDPDPIVQSSLAAGTGGGAGGAGGTGTDPAGGATADIGSIAKAAAFSTFFTMPGLFDTVESTQLTGQKSLMNDQPLMPFVQQLTNACLRQFMSTPSGDFFAFYPDYFGGFGKAPYWYIEDIEIISGSIDLSDDQLATHVYVVGDIVGPPSGAFGSSTVDTLDKIQTGGVVTVFNAFMADFMNGVDTPVGGKVDKTKYPTLAEKADAIAFLQKYGARPYYEEQPTVRAPIYESFLAYQKFCLKWSEQFKTQFEFTFMPELFPGGIVAFPSHGLQCYVNSVTHNCSYENGFTTTAELSAPSAYKANGKAVDPDKSWVHAGMIRSWPVDPNVGTFEGATNVDPAAQDKKASGQNGSGTVNGN